MLMRNIFNFAIPIVLLLALFVMLYITFNYEDVKIVPEVIAAVKDQSSTSSKKKTDQSSVSNNGDMIDLLARLINGEARGEPYNGMVAVGAVVLNRVENPNFPSTVAGVIYQGGAFDAVSDGQINLTPSTAAYNAARDALNGWDPTGGAIYYFNPVTATNKWIWSRPHLITIGKHRFCK